jgi:Predicted Rossmann fold nucleotide-binding protein involved in DNA uptake
MVKIDNAITIFDKEYPKELLNLEFPPFVLYFKGDLKLLECDHKIAIVGSRSPSMYALKATKALVMNKKDSVIISGLAKGIDACAHENAKKKYWNIRLWN